jgi:hypothetical protein
MMRAANAGSHSSGGASFPNITDNDQVDNMSQLVGYLDQAIWRARFYKERSSSG